MLLLILYSAEARDIGLLYSIPQTCISKSILTCMRNIGMYYYLLALAREIHGSVGGVTIGYIDFSIKLLFQAE